MKAENLLPDFSAFRFQLSARNGFVRAELEAALSSLLAVQVRFRKNYMGNAFIGKLSCFSSRRGAVNRPLFSLSSVNLPRLIGKPRSDVFEILFNVMVNLKKHFLKFSRRWRRRRCSARCLCRRSWLLLLYMYGAGMRYLLNFCRAASRTGNQVLLGLFLILLEARKPALKVVYFLAEKIIDHHKLSPTIWRITI
jgi:hypothetical protein